MQMQRDAQVAACVDLKRLKLQGQNLPKSACLQHSGKIVVWGTRKQRDTKSNEKMITWNVLFVVKKTDCPGN